MVAAITEVTVLAWAVAVMSKALGARSVSLLTATCGWSVMVVLTSSPPVAVLLDGFAGGASALSSQLGWIAALGALSRSLLAGYYGGFQPPWSRGLRRGVFVVAAALACIRTISWYIPETSWSLAGQVSFGLAIGLLGAANAVLAGAASRLVRGRHRLSMLVIVVGSLLACESGCIAVAEQLRKLLEHPSMAPTALLTNLALTAFGVGGMLRMVPHRGHRVAGSTVSALEDMWAWLAPSEPALTIREQSDDGPWVSDAVIQIHDRIALLQQWVPDGTARPARIAARRHGMSRRDAHTTAIAECLWRAARVQRRGRKPCARPTRLTGLGGGRWLDDEIAWLLALHHPLSLIAHSHPGAARQPEPRPSRSPLADPELRERCQQRLDAWLPPPRPASLAAIRAACAQRRERPIDVVLSEHLSGAGLYAKTPDLDVFLINRNLSPFMRLITEAHELGHLICNHRPKPLDPPDEHQRTLAHVLAATPDLPESMVIGVRSRCGHNELDWEQDPDEAEAELTGRLLIAHLIHAPAAGLAQLVE